MVVNVSVDKKSNMLLFFLFSIFQNFLRYTKSMVGEVFSYHLDASYKSFGSVVQMREPRSRIAKSFQPFRGRAESTDFQSIFF